MPTPPSKPLTPYVKFSRVMMGQIRRENSDLTRMEIAKKVSEKWESVSEHDRKQYEKDYEAEKTDYHKRMQWYYKSEEYKNWYKAKGMPGLQIIYDGSEEKPKRVHTSGTQGICNWCKKDGALQDFSTHDGVREIFISGLCSARCFELAVRRVRDNEDFNVVGHFDEIKTSPQDASTSLKTNFSKPEIYSTDEEVVDITSPILIDETDKSPTTETVPQIITDESPKMSVPTALILQNNPNSNFNWDKYLQETESVAAPWACFKQARTPPHNGFKLGMKLEVTDPRNVKTTCIATVVGVLGPRIRCRFDGTDSQNDVWRMVDDKEIHPVGWCEGNGGFLQPPVGFKLDAGKFARVIVKSLAAAELAPVRLFKREPPSPKRNMFTKGMKLEAVDPKNQALICVASVAEVEGDMIRIDFDGYLGSDYRCRYDSRDLFPVGWCYFSGYPLQPPGRSKKALLKQAQMAKQHKEKDKDKEKDKGKQETSTSPAASPSATATPPPTTLIQKTVLTPPTSLNCSDPSDTPMSSANTVQLYINHGCQVGEYLLPEKVTGLPLVFQGTVAAVVREALQAIVDCAKDQKLVLGFLRPGQGKTIIYAKSGKQTIKCCLQNVDRVSIFWRVMERFSDKLRCCENLFCGSKRLKFQCPKCGGNNAEVIQRSLIKPASFVKSSPASSSTSHPTTSKRRKMISPTSEEPPGKRMPPATLDDEDSSCFQIGSTSPPNTWSVDEVVKYIEGSDLSEYTELFRKHEIDGKALLLLTRDMITSYMGLKLGPAVKLLRHIDALKQIQSS